MGDLTAIGTPAQIEAARARLRAAVAATDAHPNTLPMRQVLPEFGEAIDALPDLRPLFSNNVMLREVIVDALHDAGCTLPPGAAERLRLTSSMLETL